jgi:allantoin racemase
VKQHILYLMPGTVSRGPLGVGELARRSEILAAWAGDRARIEVGDLDEGAGSIECFSDEALSVTPTAVRVRQAVNSGVDAIVMGCYADTILEAARELSPGPVIGPGQASMHYAAMLGERFSILTVLPSVVPMIRRLVKLYGLESHVASILPVGISVVNLPKAGRESYQRLLDQGRNAIEKDGADTLILGCMSMAFQPHLADELQSELGVPILNPARVAIDVAISLCTQNLSHSGRAYPLRTAEALASLRS